MPKKDAVILNSAAALYVAGAAETMVAAVGKAREIVESKKGLEQLERFAELSNR